MRFFAMIDLLILITIYFFLTISEMNLCSEIDQSMVNHGIIIIIIIIMIII